MVCNQSEGKNIQVLRLDDIPFAKRTDYIRLAAITYQSFGLDKKRTKFSLRSFFGGTTQNRTGDKGFAGPCLTAWPWCRIKISENKGHLKPFKCPWSGLRGSNSLPPPWQGGALPDELNPHNPWCLRSESNQRHGDFQSPALPTELQRRMGNGDLDGARTHDL